MLVVASERAQLAPKRSVRADSSCSPEPTWIRTNLAMLLMGTSPLISSALKALQTNMNLAHSVRQKWIYIFSLPSSNLPFFFEPAKPPQLASASGPFDAAKWLLHIYDELTCVSGVAGGSNGGGNEIERAKREREREREKQEVSGQKRGS